ncbi:MAG TPA: ATP-dependent zinc metalloprotease FtsH [Anaerolineae bacterium]|nr:ATP-dependent zinc metalloprotease FtsH [Anaerolineae bacterium]
MRSGYWRNGLVYLLILAAIALLLWQVMGRANAPEKITVTELAQLIKEDRVQQVSTTDEKIEIVYTSGGKQTQAVAYKEMGVGLLETLQGLGVTAEDLQGVVIEAVPPPDWLNIVTALGTILPTLIIVGMIYFMLRQAQGTNNQALSFGKSRARMFTGDQSTVTFDDVAGVEEAKEELQEVVEFLKEPEKFLSLGARIPKGVLLVGAPGTGKTLMAKAVSGEAGVPFFSISGSEFVEMFVGVGASRVRDLFDQAKRHSPCIVFVDEIDAVGRHRGAGLGGSHDEREQTLNQILVEMDGFDTDTNVIVIAATNRPDILDPALLRPGRFDRRVVLDRPDVKGREAILAVHVKGKPLQGDVDLQTVAKLTPGFVGADIENLVNEAAILAARRNKKTIAMEEFQEAIERVIAGPERKSRLISEEEKEIIAYHEAGHAVVQKMLPKCDPVRKITIVSRGMALGYTMSLPENDHLLQSRSRFRDQMAGMLGGRAAEQIMFGDITTGASNDLERITDLARKMVKRYGMSEKLGAMTFGGKEELIFLGREISEQRDYSEAVAQDIDEEVRNLISEAYERAEQVLTEQRDRLVAVATRLIEVETLDSDEFEAIMNGVEV